MGRMSEENLINCCPTQDKSLNNEDLNNDCMGNFDFPLLSAIAAVSVIVASKIHEVKAFNAVNINILIN
jgi:hypothetical protein